MSTPATTDLDALVAYFRQPGLYTRLQTELEAAGLERLPLFEAQPTALTPFLEEFRGQLQSLSLNVFPHLEYAQEATESLYSELQPEILLSARIYEGVIEKLFALWVGNYI